MQQLTVLAAALAAAAVLAAAFAAILGGEERRGRLSDVLAFVRGEGRRRASSRQGKAAAPRQRLTRPRRAEEPLPWPFSYLDRLQQQAGEYEGPMRLLLTAVLASVAVGVAAWLLTGQPALVAGGALGGLAAPAVLLKAKAARRVALVEDQVAAACLRLSQALGAGMPLERAFADTAREMPAPLGEEMRATLTEAELHGVPLEAAMGDMVRRLPHAPSLRMLVASMQVAMEMGADLADQLARLADVIQQRRLAVARIASVTATARTQAKVLAFVPLAAFVWVHTLSPQTVAGYETFGGQVKLLLIAAWVVLGYVVSQGIVSGLVGRVM